MQKTPLRNRTTYYVFTDKCGTWISSIVPPQKIPYEEFTRLQLAKHRYAEITGQKLCVQKGCVCFCVDNKKELCFVHTNDHKHWNYDEDGVMYTPNENPLTSIVYYN